MAISREILFISATVAFVYSGLTVIFPILPFYFEQFGGGPTEFGIAASSFAVAVFIFSPITGTLADRSGKVKVITYSLLGYGITNIGFVFVTSNFHIIVLRFLEGVFTAGVVPAAISIASDLSDEHNRARSIAFVTAGISFGVIIGPLIGGTLILYYPLYVPFLVSAGLGIFASLFSHVLLNEPEVEEMSEETSTVRFVDKIPKPLYAFGALLIVNFILSFTWLLIEPGFVFYFYNDLGYNSQQFGIFIASYGAFVFVGEVVLGGLSDRFGRLRIIFIGSIINTLWFLTLSVATALPVLLIAAAIAGVAIGLIGPALNALLSEVSLPQFRTYVFGVSTAFVGLSQIIGPLMGGWLIDQPGITIAVLAIFSSIITAISAFFVVFFRFQKPDASDENDRYLISEVQTTFTK